ncbi:MAG: type II toxin-antitoxin system prevent-host-death family antitoxin [Gammaproteobacteria bacterium]|nr:type II toxin-antitoxin system prevent-host-death family antitoxin [Gammaproteobacteria bacterium]MDD9869984.1 type II toxin-antitoxin system prevent-host-death family antitoxin [Gammaproteobacteria bacterium]
MIKVGAIEAKTQLSALLQKVSEGEEVLITEHGRAVARLVSAGQDGKSRAASHSVVAPSCKDEYAARGNPRRCSDWLARELDGQFCGADGGFDEPAFTRMLVDNGVELAGDWAELPRKRTPGWQGRYHMNGRRKLEIRILRQGHLKLHGREVTPGPDVLRELQARHPGVLRAAIKRLLALRKEITFDEDWKSLRDEGRR